MKVMERIEINVPSCCAECKYCRPLYLNGDHKYCKITSKMISEFAGSGKTRVSGHCPYVKFIEDSKEEPVNELDMPLDTILNPKIYEKDGYYYLSFNTYSTIGINIYKNTIPAIRLFKAHKPSMHFTLTPEGNAIVIDSVTYDLEKDKDGHINHVELIGKKRQKLTKAEIEKRLGYPVEIVEEKNE